MSRVDFSRGASSYDRRHGAMLEAAAAARLIESASLGNPSIILDLGAGTGRVSVAFASIGHRVVAIDVARPMLQALRDKAGAVPVQVAAAEGARLPFADARFDAVVLSRRSQREGRRRVSRAAGLARKTAVSIGPGPRLSLDAFLTRIVDGECSYTWNVPADVQARYLPELKAWASTRFNLVTELPMPREMIWRVYAKS